jgi:iron complex outermembrane recepter protein
MRRNFSTHIGSNGHRMRPNMFPVLFPVMLALLLSTSRSTAASDPTRQARYAIDQPAQPLSEALHTIARKTGNSVLFDPVAVSGLTAAPVSGQFSAAEAIAQALQGSGLVMDVMRDRSIVVRPAVRPAATRSPLVSGDGLSSPSSPSAVKPGDELPVRLAQLLPATTSDAGGAARAATGAEPLVSTRVEVTGSRLKRIDAEGAQPINTYTRDDIDRSGQPSLERFLSSLNEASVAPGEGSFGTISGQASVQLRGLPVGSTLVLINGRRVQAVGSSTANIFNLNLIPLAAVERIDIVPVGSSAVYGGDALAGVVNIILKSKLDGQSFNVRMASGRGFGDGSVSLAGGASSERGGFLVLGTYARATPLATSERPFFADADYRRFGGRDARSRNCTPGTVSSATGANLPGLNASFAGIPAAPPGQPLTIASFTPSAGQANLCNNLANGNGSALIHGNESMGVHASGFWQVGQAASLFTELTYVKDTLRTQEGGLLLNNLLVPASNVHNPFGVPVRVTARLGAENGTEGIERRTDFTRLLLGVRGELSPRWDYEASVSTTRDDGDRLLLNGTVNAAARTTALAASTVASALNPFSTARAASDEVLRGIWTDSARQNAGRKDQASAFVRGAVIDLPAGPVDAIVGIEWARDRYEAVVPGTTVGNSRRADAVFSELRVPLLRGGGAGGGAGERAKGWSLMALSLAGRRDSTSDFGAASTFQAGLELRPARSLLFRASAASSFKPPTLLQTSVNDLSLPLGSIGLFDPARGGEPVLAGELVRSTNTGLQPEQGRAFSVGALWEPGSASGTRLGLTAWRVKIDGLIALLAPQLLLDNETLFGFVSREPSVGGVPGVVKRLTWAEVNFGSVQTAGLDLEAAHSWQGAAGRWTLGASATRARQYDVAIAPGAPVQQRLGKRFAEYWAPKWKGRMSANLDEGRWSLGITSRYLGDYQDGGSSQTKLGNTWVHDLNGRVNLNRLGLDLGPAKTATLALSIVNLTNQQPQFAQASPYFDASQADWRGRYLSLRLSLDW